MRDHLKQAAARRMIFPVGLKVLSQMLDPAGEKCDLHVRAAGIVFMQLKLCKISRLVALCHNEGATLDEDRVLATHALKSLRAAARSFVNRTCLAFAIVPQTQSGT
jgi:hypothetical protein